MLATERKRSDDDHSNFAGKIQVFEMLLVQHAQNPQRLFRVIDGTKMSKGGKFT